MNELIDAILEPVRRLIASRFGPWVLAAVAAIVFTFGGIVVVELAARSLPYAAFAALVLGRLLLDTISDIRAVFRERRERDRP